MTPTFSRRSLLAVPLIGLAACAGTFGSYAHEDAVRRLLRISSERAFARLLQDDGFAAAELMSEALPEGARERLRRQVAYAAGAAARVAVPAVRESIRDIAIIDAAAIVRGSPTAATEMLRQVMGEALFTALAPEIGNALRAGDAASVDQVLANADGINFEGLRLEVARRTSDAIYRAIGEEEAAIRADPRSVRDFVLRSSLP